MVLGKTLKVGSSLAGSKCKRGGAGSGGVSSGLRGFNGTEGWKRWAVPEPWQDW